MLLSNDLRRVLDYKGFWVDEDNSLRIGLEKRGNQGAGVRRLKVRDIDYLKE
jgi:hypothetical protein